MSLNKKRVSVNIAGNKLTLVTDQNSEFVNEVTRQLDEKMRSITKNNFRISATDAALLCALSATEEKIKSSITVRSLEAKIELLESAINQLKSENDGLYDLASLTKEGEPEIKNPDTFAAEFESITAASSRDEKIAALSEYLENKKAKKSHVSDDSERRGRIKYIESLLRGYDK